MMALIAKESGGGTFTPVPQGMHLARCYRVVDLGTQKSEYLGTVKHLPKVMLQFEVHGEDENGKPIVTAKNEPMTISKNFTLSLAEKATLRKDLQTWRGREFTPEELRGFELKNVLGAWAMISVIKAAGANGKEYTNIAGIMSVPPAIKKAGLPEGFNTPAIFSIDEPDMTMFETFSDGLKQKIMGSPEWQSRGGYSEPSQANKTSSEGSGFDDMDDDIPF
jgi:hypothetical protein